MSGAFPCWFCSAHDETLRAEDADSYDRGNYLLRRAQVFATLANGQHNDEEGRPVGPLAHIEVAR